MPSTPLTTRISVKDRDGRVIEEKEVATYAGLLSRAHEEGLTQIATTVVALPAEDNAYTAVISATVTTSRGTFTGIGDANSGNVGRKIVPHLIRMAETRAKARALRDAVNIGVVSLEELGGDDFALESASTGTTNVRPFQRASQDRDRRTADHARPNVRSNERGDFVPATENQCNYLYRHLAERGMEGQAAHAELCRVARIPDVRQLSKGMASRLIEQLRQAETRAS